jgi:hypothetical protein
VPYREPNISLRWSEKVLWRTGSINIPSLPGLRTGEAPCQGAEVLRHLADAARQPAENGRYPRRNLPPRCRTPQKAQRNQFPPCRSPAPTCRSPAPRCRTPPPGCRNPAPRCRNPPPGCRSPAPRCRNRPTHCRNPFSHLKTVNLAILFSKISVHDYAACAGVSRLITVQADLACSDSAVNAASTSLYCPQVVADPT